MEALTYVSCMQDMQGLCKGNPTPVPPFLVPESLKNVRWKDP